MVGESVTIALSVGLSAAIAVIISKITERKIMGAVADALRDVGAQLAKIKREQQQRVEDLQAQLDAKGALDADDQAALDELRAGLNELDDLVPDEPVVTPAPNVVEQVDTTGETVSPPTGDTAGYIAEGEPIPDPTGDAADTDLAAGDDDAAVDVADDEPAAPAGAAPADDPAVADDAVAPAADTVDPNADGTGTSQ
ncbi:hypothetical protein KHQ86_gp022 [Gordonia phage Stormageddon]|uniref:Uncharacterized protein n=1 Tax=Gordonia phage Stormageddon TaxID=2656541 RepID=A0A649VSA4_9CAUD|nr:hypothetical protein KHQ86_gp022 [Gordonia phage Stormageddon]QGJ94885.1 hypothetical protein SEA_STORMAGEDDON_22 [Gordonia phage Stormageddon]